jgi:uncharacterized LabA/DUF88 family protein
LARIHVFIDYQNLHLSGTETFAPMGTPPRDTLIHPAAFADRIMARRAEHHRPEGELAEVHVYRGQANPNHQPELAAATEAQAAHWTRDRRVRMHRRALDYPPGWPNSRRPVREKGVDVMLACDFVRHAIEHRADILILVSRDTDLLPAVEMVVDLGDVVVETAMWSGCSRLRMRGRPLWCTLALGDDFVHSRDRRPY